MNMKTANYQCPRVTFGLNPTTPQIPTTMPPVTAQQVAAPVQVNQQSSQQQALIDKMNTQMHYLPGFIMGSTLGGVLATAVITLFRVQKTVPAMLMNMIAVAAGVIAGPLVQKHLEENYPVSKNI